MATIFGTALNDTIIGTAGNDLLGGRGGDDRLIGGAGSDTLIGGTGGDRLEGGAGIDWASYQTALGPVAVMLDNPFFAGSGDAAFDSFFSIENLLGSRFNDFLGGDAGANVINGGTGGSDTLSGQGGNDTLVGGSENDVLRGGTGADALIGGTGIDTASYEFAASGVAVILNAPFFAGTGEARGDSYTSIENLLGSGFSDSLTGDDNTNSIGGGGGDDVLRGGVGGDVLDGGAGIDAASYSNAASGVTADLLGIEISTGDAAGDTYFSIENIGGSSFGDRLLGDNGNNAIGGGLSGNDTLFGRGGDDWVAGGSGNDFLEGGEGADLVDGGTGIDTASYANAAAGVTADLFNPAANGGEAFGDTYVLIENLLGSSHNDTLRGDAGGNLIDGGSGNDELYGRDGNDRLIGGFGNDVLFGGSSIFDSAGIDTLIGGLGNDLIIADNGDIVNGGAGNFDIVNAAASTALAGFVFSLAGTFVEHVNGGDGNDTIDAIGTATGSIHGQNGNDSITGGSGVDGLVGGSGDDTIIGGDGNDVIDGSNQVTHVDDGRNLLIGGNGNDVLTSGLDADTFVFDTALNATANLDIIAAFSGANDTIQLDNAVFVGLAAGPLSAAAFTIGTAASDADDRIIYDPTGTGTLYFDPDGTGAAAQIQFVIFNNSPVLTSANFQVI